MRTMLATLSLLWVRTNTTSFLRAYWALSNYALLVFKAVGTYERSAFLSNAKSSSCGLWCPDPRVFCAWHKPQKIPWWRWDQWEWTISVDVVLWVTLSTMYYAMCDVDYVLCYANCCIGVSSSISPVTYNVLLLYGLAVSGGSNRDSLLCKQPLYSALCTTYMC